MNTKNIKRKRYFIVARTLDKMELQWGLTSIWGLTMNHLHDSG